MTHLRYAVLLLVLCLYHQAGGQPGPLGAPIRDSLISGSPDRGYWVDVGITSRSFFWNREFFNKITQGATYPGHWFEPTVVLHLKGGATFRAGVNAHLLFGSRRKTVFLPVFSVQQVFHPFHSPRRQFSVCIGRLEPMDERARDYPDPSPVFRQELNLTDPVENGVQLAYRSPRLKADTWVTWQRFLEPGDTLQEQFYVGLQAEWAVWPVSQEGFRISVPFEAVFTHRGGQIVQNEKPLQTLGNMGAGVRFSRSQTAASRPTSLEWMTFVFMDASPVKQLDFSKGWATRITIRRSYPHWQPSLLYWYGYHFLAPLGDPAYWSSSDFSAFHTEPSRSLLGAGLEFIPGGNDADGLHLRGQALLDLKKGSFDYAYGLFLSYRHTIGISGQHSLKENSTD